MFWERKLEVGFWGGGGGLGGLGGYLEENLLGLEGRRLLFCLGIIILEGFWNWERWEGGGFEFREGLIIGLNCLGDFGGFVVIVCILKLNLGRLLFFFERGCWVGRVGVGWG